VSRGGAIRDYYDVPSDLLGRLNSADQVTQEEAARELGALWQHDSALRDRCREAEEAWERSRRERHQGEDR
jgi:hypothetical protein